MTKELYGGEPRIVERSYSNGYEYVVYSHNTHPCCYIALTKSDPDYDKDYNYIEGVRCHGCLTYSANAEVSPFRWADPKSWIIGWDYAHIGDYTYGISNLPGYVWLLEELREEIGRVTSALKFKKSWMNLYK